ncbi:MAG: hypothetical protein EHM37_03885 [Deltaproteobacteria bacterium]|nr:MAG: hypothetical protein EHM37_03885 [Deltaproteobacteria bacterium]
MAGIKVGSLYFDHETFALKPQKKGELGQLGKFLQANLEKRCPAELFRSRGAPDYNIKLSRERAEAVADYLTKICKLDSGS